MWKSDTLKFADSLGNSITSLYKLTKEPLPGFLSWINSQKIDSNLTKLQQNKAKVNSCGYHCAVRIIEHQMSHRAYAKWLKGAGMTPDDTVAFLCLLTFHRIRRISKE